MEEARHKRTNIVWFHLYEVRRIDKFIKTESRIVLPGAGGRGSEQLLSNKYRVSVWDNEKVLEVDSGDSSTAL